MSRTRLIGIDLDGTLIDSAPDLGYALKNMLEQLDMAPVTGHQIRTWIGNGVNLLVKRALTGTMNPPDQLPQFEQALSVFSDFYEQNINERGCLYPGVREGLSQLRADGFILACLTNKHSRFTHKLLEQSGLAEYFDFVVCGDTFEQRKPHPMPLLKTAEHFSVDPKCAVMVGDSINDIKAAKAAGFMSVSVPYGYLGKYTVDDLAADHSVESLDQLSALLRAA